MTAETIHTCSYECLRPECIRAQRDELVARLTAETSNARGEWLQSGGLLYRLTDERRPQNCDEINVMMANGSRYDADRHARAAEILALLKAAPPPAVPYDRELIARIITSGCQKYDSDVCEEQARLLRAADNASAVAETVSRSPAAARGDVLDDNETAWREGWALAYSGARNLYGDDGELQDNRRPPIDWRRDSALEIRRKIEERGNLALFALSQQPEPKAEARGGVDGVVYAALRSIRYNAEYGSQDRPLHVRLSLIAEEANKALVACEAALTESRNGR